jgi:hypothetical protein
MSHRNRSRNRIAKIESAPLDWLTENYPADWEIVGKALVEATATKRSEAIESFVREAQKIAAPHRQRAYQAGKNPQILADALPHLVRARMALLSAQHALRTAALAASGGRRRFGLWSGFLVQKLFFARGLDRKPISIRAFRWLWPLVTQKRLLMPLVQSRGMYAFYSGELIQSLARLIDHRPALEIAAGDGCLSAFLNQIGTEIRPTDDHSWSQNIRFPESVEKLDATTALERYRPTAVVCSYPPPKNAFEAKVFQTDSVEMYLVITTKHRFAAGDWQSYESQTTFELQADPALARLVLPPEIDPLVLVFRRKSSAGINASLPSRTASE